MARRRRTVLGLPIGRRRSPVTMGRVLTAGAGIAAVPAAVAAGKRVVGLVSSGAETAHKVSDVADKAGRITEAIGQHSSTVGKVGAAISEVAKLSGGGEGAPKLSHLIEEHTEVAVPRTVAYNQWTQFEVFPSITKGAEQVEQKARNKAEWTSKIGPSRRSWMAEITEQVPDERIAWKSEGGLTMKGVVTFHSLDDELTRILVEIEYTPRGPVELVGNLLRIQRRRVRRDLRLFKHFLELRGEATGAWRNRIAKKSEGAEARSEDDDESETERDSRRARRAGGTSESSGGGPRKATGRRTTASDSSRGDRRTAKAS